MNRTASNQTNPPALIEMRDITKTFHTAAGEFQALKGINVSIHAGEFVAVVGKSGSGKSTLINMITGIDRPTSGKVIINGTDIHAMSESQMAIWRGKNLGIVFQFYQLLPMLSLLENVMLPMQIANVFPANEHKDRALNLLEMVGLQKEAYKMPAAVSGGQQQSAAIARALANDPTILITDEPTGNLDSRSAENVFQIFHNLVQQGKTVVIVTHDNQLAQRSNRTLLLSDGEVINETIATTLPLLSHQQMLRATKSHKPMQYAPGEVIIRQGESHGYFYMINRGFVDVTLEEPNGGDRAIARLGPGQYFGEIELLHASKPVAGIRAAGGEPVELIALDRQIFNELMADATAMRAAIYKVSQERLGEHQARGGQPRPGSTMQRSLFSRLAKRLRPTRSASIKENGDV